jgi:hypothetical protein
MSIPLHMEGARVWCDRHWARVRGGDGTSATLALLVVALESNSLVEKANLIDGMTDDQEGEAISRAIQECSPLCCWVAPDQLEKVYVIAKDPTKGNGHGR